MSEEKRPIRNVPTWRIPFGMVLLIAALMVYAGVVARVVGPWIAAWPVWAQVPVYVAFGLLWLLPMKRFLIWMEVGR
jgi:hypothetical protein